jgi:hypothetical protein
MFGRRIQVSAASPSAAAPPSAGSTEPRTGGRRQKTVPAWLFPWLMPLVIVLAVVVFVVVPGFVAGVLGLLVVAGLAWLLSRAFRGQNTYELTRNDRFLKGRDHYPMTRNDRSDRDDSSE